MHIHLVNRAFLVLTEKPENLDNKECKGFQDPQDFRE